MLGYDRSESSRNAARWAASELASGGKLVIVYACRAQHMPPTPLSSSGVRHDEGRAILDELMLDGEPALFDIELETEVSDRDPAAALIDTAERHVLARSCSAQSRTRGCTRRLARSLPSCCEARRCP